MRLLNAGYHTHSVCFYSVCISFTVFVFTQSVSLLQCLFLLTLYLFFSVCFYSVSISFTEFVFTQSVSLLQCLFLLSLYLFYSVYFYSVCIAFTVFVFTHSVSLFQCLFLLSLYLFYSVCLLNWGNISIIWINVNPNFKNASVLNLNCITFFKFS